MAKITLNNVENTLVTLQSITPELENFSIQKSDIRYGKKIVLVDENKYFKTDFLTYSEMFYYLIGYYDKTQNRFKTK